EGQYTLRVICWDAYDHQTDEDQSFSLDRTAPPPPVIAPPPARVIEQILDLSLSFNTQDTDSIIIYRLHEGVTDSTINTRYIDPTVSLNLGRNDIWTKARDRAGNTSEKSNTVSVVFDLSTGLSYPEVFRAPGTFQIITVETARQVDIELYDLRGERARKITAWGPSTKFEIGWDLKNGAGQYLRNGPYLLVITVFYDSYETVEKNFIAVVR
ncbi:MAG: hypothetical protein JXB45_03290, partial [Candidatus Krumholzibacteriota bacterium]|nr:hypothetical protein [Candidatus Krumholzibacteriota bacterium]